MHEGIPCFIAPKIITKHSIILGTLGRKRQAAAKEQTFALVRAPLLLFSLHNHHPFQPSSSGLLSINSHVTSPFLSDLYSSPLPSPNILSCSYITPPISFHQRPSALPSASIFPPGHPLSISIFSSSPSGKTTRTFSSVWRNFDNQSEKKKKSLEHWERSTEQRAEGRGHISEGSNI